MAMTEADNKKGKITSVGRRGCGDEEFIPLASSPTVPIKKTMKILTPSACDFFVLSFLSSLTFGAYNKFFTSEKGKIKP